MRILRFFILFFLVLVIVGVSGFLIMREVLLAKAESEIRSAIRKMDTVAYSRSQYNNACLRRGGSGGQRISSVELRFTDDTNYQIVAICEYYASEPIIVSSFTLPYFVKKMPGEAGLIWDPTGKSGFYLSMWGVEKTIILDGTDFISQRGVQKIDGNRPQASCQGFGYSCCDAVTQAGTGDTMSIANDCPSSCFLQCEPRPVVLRMYSDPPPDIRTKVVTVSPGTLVSIFYTMDTGLGKEIEVTVDFGDGQREIVKESEGSVSHTYTCATATCDYVATIQAIDAFAHKSAMTTTSSMTVRVQ